MSIDGDAIDKLIEQLTAVSGMHADRVYEGAFPAEKIGSRDPVLVVTPQADTGGNIDCEQTQREVDVVVTLIVRLDATDRNQFKQLREAYDPVFLKLEDLANDTGSELLILPGVLSFTEVAGPESGGVEHDKDQYGARSSVFKLRYERALGTA